MILESHKKDSVICYGKTIPVDTNYPVFDGVKVPIGPPLKSN